MMRDHRWVLTVLAIAGSLLVGGFVGERMGERVAPPCNEPVITRTVEYHGREYACYFDVNNKPEMLVGPSDAFPPETYYRGECWPDETRR